MSESPALRFYPASAPGPTLPLGRYLPPLPQGMVSSWLAEHVPPGGWLLDPLGASPALALEAARAGYRVLVACNNPILSFMIETLAAAPQAADFHAALAELAMARRGEERLEKHLRELYQTECANCGQAVMAEAFIWQRDAEKPAARVYHCPNCGEEGEQPTTPGDEDRLDLPGSDALHRSRALQRVVMSEDEYREDVEQALSTYLPRPLYVLFTLINKLEGLGLPPERLRLMHALLISAFDAGNTLWPHPVSRARPRQLNVPPQFRENNLWDALESAVGEWTSGGVRQPAVAVTRWPNLPPAEGGICLYRGRIKTLVPLPEELGPHAVVAAFPRPNQAFWTLSALWAGWLWGREAALPLRNVLDRRRYDWNWHTSALHSALAALSRAIPPRTPFFGVIPELNTGFLTAALIAAEAAGFHLEGLALRDGNLAQAVWQPGGAITPPAPDLEEIARTAMRHDLLERNEPASYLTVFAAGISALARARAIPERMPSIPGDLFTRTQAALNRAFADRTFLRLYGGSESASEERGWWWLANPAQTDKLPLSDLVEMEIVRYLQKHPDCAFAELERALCEQFTGLLTPPSDLVRACLESYADPLTRNPGHWRLRPGETSAARKTDLNAMRSHLDQLGKALGYAVRPEGESALVWEEGGAAAWRFYLMASSIISRFVFNGETAQHCLLVLPASRANLLRFKFKHNPRLEEAARGWHLLSFRKLRDLAAKQELTREIWDEALKGESMLEKPQQLRLGK